MVFVVVDVDGFCVVFVVVDVDGCRVVVLGDKVKAVAVTFTRGMDVGAVVCLEDAAGEREAVVAVTLATVFAVALAAVDGDDVAGAPVDALADAVVGVGAAVVELWAGFDEGVDGTKLVVFVVGLDCEVAVTLKAVGETLVDWFAVDVWVKFDTDNTTP